MPRHANSTSFKKGQKYLNGRLIGSWNKGRIPWNKGKKQWNGKLPEKIKEKIRNKLKGRQMPWLGEYRKRGKDLSKYTIVSCKICKKNFRAKKWDVEHANKQYCSLFCSNKSRAYSPELYKRIVETNRKRGNYEKIRLRMLKGGAAKARLGAKKKPTKIEKLMKSYLEELGLEEKKDFENEKLIGWHAVDFYVPKTRTIIECDGDYWHNYPQGTEFDKRQTEYYQRKGYQVLRFWEHEINNEKEKIMDNLLGVL